MRRLPKSHRRRGNVLLLFALLTFALFAVAGITIDLGFARLAHRQMQGATDAAALEGLRYRDGVPPWLADPNSVILPQMQQDGVDPANADEVQRWMARNIINQTFASSIDPATGNPIQYGVGPVFQLSGGTGDANALQTITMPTPGIVTVYQPKVQLNVANKQEGDLVTGNFVPGMSPQEAADYTRSDFLPSPAGSTGTPDSFLVRLRRTRDTQGNPPRNMLDDEQSVSTTGPALPLLFAQGSLVAGGDPTSGYSPRHHGIAVRGTSIARGRPVVAVGTAVKNDPITGANGMAGAASFFIKLADWNSLSTFDTSLVSFFVAQRSMILGGDSLAPVGSGVLPGKDSNQVYVPLVNSSNVVAGFGFVTYNLDGTISKLSPRVASENATASMAVYRLNPTDPSIPDPTIILSMFSANPNPEQLLMAPALVR